MHNKLALLNIHYLSVHHKNMPLNPMQINPHSLYTMVENMTVPKIIYLTTIPPSWGLLVIPESSCEGFSQRTAANFNFSPHVHKISYILYIIYIHFIYITYIIYISYISTSSTSTSSTSYTSSTYIMNTIYRCSAATSLLQNSYDVICTGVLT